MGIPTVNIGDRQKGRVYGETVLNCNDNETEIESINYALSDGFKQNASTPNPYGKGQASKNIIEKLINLPLENLIFKSFLTYRKSMNSYQTQKHYKKLELLYFCLKAII